MVQAPGPGFERGLSIVGYPAFSFEEWAAAGLGDFSERRPSGFLLFRRYCRPETIYLEWAYESFD